MRHLTPAHSAALAAALLTLAAGSAAKAEEGMWTFDNFPIAPANQTLGTSIDQAWLDRVRLSSVKFGGCSAGIVSGEGLVMTNNHCVATCVANLSTQAINYAETGFTPRTREEELKCPGGSAEILTDIADGQVQGWSYRGVTVPAFTYMGGLYERATGSEPFNLAQAFADNESRVNKDVVYDFSSTNDIIGGNSGSPVVNAAGEVIGAAFDGNIHSLGGSFGYDGELNRTVSVSTAAITEALRNVYPNPRLLQELGVDQPQRRRR